MNNARPALRFNTAVPLSILEDYLNRECSSQWDLRLEGIGEDLSQKVVKITFENADDVAKFKAAYSTLKNTYV